MTEYRPLTAWLRLLAGLLALTGALGLAGCGGGSGAPNNVFNAPGALTVLPGPTVVAYSGFPATLTISGGQPPYKAFSSDSGVLPVTQNVAGSTIPLFASAVGIDTNVTITVQDSPPGATAANATVAVTVRPNPLITALTLKADGFGTGCPNPGGSASAVDAAAQTFICAGQTGSLAVKTVGGGRQIKFDVVQGDFQIFTNGPGQPPTFALSYTVPSDQNGDAIVRVQALSNATHQVVIVQATDLLTGTFVRGIFIVTNGANGGLLVVPATVNITGPDNLTCSSGVTTSFFIFGGSPPFTISNTFPQFLTVTPTVVNSVGAGFNVTTLGGCITNGIIAITDALGHTTTVTVTNALGSNPPPSFTTPIPIVISPSAVQTLTCTNTVGFIATGGGTVTQQGNTTTTTPATQLFVSVSDPTAVNVSLANPAPGQGFALTRVHSATITTTSPLTLTVSDGHQLATKTVTIPTPGTPCP